jgi:ABC-type enterochelin transport system permease subunit
MSAGRILTSILLLACATALVGPVSVNVPFAYHYTISTTETVPLLTAFWHYEFWSGAIEYTGATFMTETMYRTNSGPAEVIVAVATITAQIPLFEVAKEPLLQPYACRHLNLTGAILFCIMQFWTALIVPLIALAGLLVYSLAKRYRKPPPGTEKVSMSQDPPVMKRTVRQIYK